MAIAAPLALNVSPAAADGVGSASARGTDPDAALEIGTLTTTVPAQFSATTNCAEASNTRPFIVQDSAGIVIFRRTSTQTSTCTSENGNSVNQGIGGGTTSGWGDAILRWRFENSPDDVEISVVSAVVTLNISGAPQPLFGSPGGVWVFGNLPWPAAP